MDYGQTIYNTARSLGINDTLANLMVAQARHETANFTSNAFVKHKNAFGYAYYKGSPYQTGNTGLIADNKRPVADYASVEDSTKEVVAWLKRRQGEGKLVIAELTTPDAYAAALKKSGYYGDSEGNYLRALRSWLDKYPKYQQMLIEGGIGLVGIALISALIYSVYRAVKK